MAKVAQARSKRIDAELVCMLGSAYAILAGVSYR